MGTNDETFCIFRFVENVKLFALVCFKTCLISGILAVLRDPRAYQDLQ